MAKSKVKNFIALASTAELKAQKFKSKKAVMFDSRSFLKWKVLSRVRDWCRAAS